MTTGQTGRVQAFFQLAAWSCLISSASISAQETDADHRLADSRTLVAEFAGKLQGALQDALQTQGVSGAIAVCRDLAPQIASELSRRSGASVSRTSSRFRNPLNAPEAWQQPVLESFSWQLAETSEAMPEYFKADLGGARFMKAIPLAPLCATCHGTDLAPEVVDALADNYPHDLATGYSVGELRGAFSVYWPVLNPEGQAPVSQ